MEPPHLLCITSGQSAQAQGPFSPMNPQEVYARHLHTCHFSRSSPLLWDTPTYTCSEQARQPPDCYPAPHTAANEPATSLSFYDVQPCPNPALEGLLSQSAAQALTPPLQGRPSVDLHPQPAPPCPALALTRACLQRPSG